MDYVGLLTEMSRLGWFELKADFPFFSKLRKGFQQRSSFQAVHIWLAEHNIVFDWAWESGFGRHTLGWLDKDIALERSEKGGNGEKSQKLH